ELYGDRFDARRVAREVGYALRHGDCCGNCEAAECRCTDVTCRSPSGAAGCEHAHGDLRGLASTGPFGGVPPWRYGVYSGIPDTVSTIGAGGDTYHIRLRTAYRRMAACNWGSTQKKKAQPRITRISRIEHAGTGYWRAPLRGATAARSAALHHGQARIGGQNRSDNCSVLHSKNALVCAHCRWADAGAIMRSGTDAAWGRRRGWRAQSCDGWLVSDSAG